MLLKSLLVSLAVPPFGFLSLALVGLLLLSRRPALGRTLLWVSTICLILLSMPLVSGVMLDALERNLPLVPPPNAPPAAIVLLGAELRRSADDPFVHVGELSLERERAAAALQRKTGLPILVSGGIVQPDAAPVASLMADSLVSDFQVPVRWRETKSRDTWENAEFSAEILRAEGITSVYIVTHAWHMRRALMAFRRTGLTVTAAPTPIDAPVGPIANDFLPRVSAWQISYYAMHEWIGCAWYALR